MKNIRVTLAVDDIKRSKDFYQRTLKQKVLFDFEDMVIFEEGLVLCHKRRFADSIEQDVNTIKKQANNVIVHIDTENFEKFGSNLKENPAIKVVQYDAEHAWGQHTIRIYDPDWNIVEIAETMECMIKRSIAAGLTAEEVAAASEYPVEFIVRCYKKYEALIENSHG